MDLKLLPTNLVKLKPYLQKLKILSTKFDLPIGVLALQYALSKDFIDGVLIGVDSLSQLQTNLDWLDIDIPQEVLTLIDTINVEETTLLNPAKW